MVLCNWHEASLAGLIHGPRRLPLFHGIVTNPVVITDRADQAQELSVVSPKWTPEHASQSKIVSAVRGGQAIAICQDERRTTPLIPHFADEFG